MSRRLNTLWARAATRLGPAALGAILLWVGIASSGCNGSKSPTEPESAPQRVLSLSASASSLPAEGGKVEIGDGEALVNSAGVVLELSYTPRPPTQDTPIRIQITATRKDSGTPVTGLLKVEFGDGKKTKVKDFDGGAEVEHAYKEVSVFQLIATVTEGKGVTTSKAFKIKVIGEVRTTLSLSVNATEAPAREPLGFKVEVGRSDGTQGRGEVTIDWGDGRSTQLGMITGKSRAEHTYRDPGSYNVLAEVVDETGRRIKSSVRVRVLDRIRVSSTLSVDSATPGVDQMVNYTFTVTRSDGKRASGTAAVTFGDGATESVTVSKNTASFKHAFTAKGTYTTSVIFDDGSDRTVTASVRLDVTVVTTTLSLSADATEVPAREPLGFKVEVGRSDGTRGRGKVTIDWGDGRSTTLGEISGTVSVEHRYRKTGSYKVVAEVIDEAGKLAKSSVRVRVQKKLQLSGTLSGDDTAPAVDQIVTYTFKVTRSDGKTASGTAAVTFGDGATESVTVSGNTARFEHAFAAEGTYTTSVIFDDGAGHTARASVRVYVSADGGGGDDAIDATGLKWLHADASNWKVSSTVTSVSVSSTQICINHTKAGGWPVRDGLEGNPWIVAQVNGTWYAATYEWLRPGQVCKGLGVPNDYPNIASALGPHIKVSPLNNWVPKSGETVYFFVSTFARAGVRSSDERSNIVKVIWP